MSREPARVVIEPHARERMAQRGIALAQIVETLRSPDAVRPARNPDARRCEKALTHRNRLAVIASASAHGFRVLSAWWM